MKDYALKINGHNYDVRIDDVNESSTLAHVVVNGTAYEVEIAGAKGVQFFILSPSSLFLNIKVRCLAPAALSQPSI